MLTPLAISSLDHIYISSYYKFPVLIKLPQQLHQIIRYFISVHRINDIGFCN